ncbi:hypothetical protein ACLQ3C_05375 [Gordonia sp. DT30]|uniref:hypothetical protein n=1 Tax=unclassified Gordonia (in: high G+C Gram-positive bacteria) TaxID=2657482 RepID=UPI003CEFA32C
MRPTIDQLESWDIAGLQTLSALAEGNAAKLDDAVDSAVRGIDNAGSWFGQTRDAAHTRITQEQDHAREVRNVLNRTADEAGDASRDLGYAKEYTLRVVRNAIGAQLDVDNFGVVSHPDPDKAEDVETQQAIITAALNTVDELDETYGSRLEGLSSDLASMVKGQPDLVVSGIGAIDPDALVSRLKGMTPDERAALLGRLTPEQLRRLAQADPDVIGNMDGVPFPVRIDANEVNIRNTLADELQKQPPDNSRIDQLKAMLTRSKIR